MILNSCSLPTGLRKTCGPQDKCHGLDLDRASLRYKTGVLTITVALLVLSNSQNYFFGVPYCLSYNSWLMTVDS